VKVIVCLVGDANKYFYAMISTGKLLNSICIIAISCHHDLLKRVLTPVLLKYSKSSR
jgi:hypothetical protein